MFNKWIRGVALALALSALMVPAALADGGTTVTVTAGTLSFTADAVPTDFADGTVGSNTTADLSAFEVSDFTGSGSGWQVTAVASQFAEWDGTAYVTSGAKLTASSLTMSRPGVHKGAGTTSGLPTIPGSSGFVLDGGSAVVIANASAGNGMGVYDFDPTTLTLFLHPEDAVGVYHSDLIFDVQPNL